MAQPSFTPRKLHERTPIEHTRMGRGVVKPYARVGVASQEEQDPGVHSAVMDELKGAISESIKDRLAHERFLARQGEDTTIGDIRGGLPETDSDETGVIQSRTPLKARSIDKYAGGSPDAELIKKFIADNPNIMTGHVRDVARGRFADQSMGSTEDIGLPTRGTSYIGEEEQNSPELLDEPEPGDPSNIRPTAFKTPEALLMREQAPEGPRAGPGGLPLAVPTAPVSRPNPLSEGSLAPLAGGTATGSQRERAQARMKKALAKLNVREYGGTKKARLVPPKKTDKVKEEKARTTGKTSGDTSFSATEKIKSLSPSEKTLPGTMKADLLVTPRTVDKKKLERKVSGLPDPTRRNPKFSSEDAAKMIERFRAAKPPEGRFARRV